MASNVEVNLVAKTSNFEENIKKATKTFEEMAYKGNDASKSLAKSFQQINKVGKDELSDLQKAFNSLQIKGDFGLGVQKEQIAEAKRFYIQQFTEIKTNAQSSASEIERAWSGLKNAFSNIDKINGGSSKGTSDFKAMMQAQQEALKMNEKFNYEKLRSDEKMYSEALRLNEKFNYDKLRQTEVTVANMKRVQAEEMASYARQGMSTSGSAAQLIGQQHAGSEFARSLKAQMEGVSEETNKSAEHTHRMNTNIFASIGMIAKMQIMFSLINTTMSAIGNAPGAAIAAIEDFNSSVIRNAAMITSMQVGVKDVGKAYLENKQYAIGVQNVLVKMDSETAASAKNLRDMNDQFVQQGIILDVNNKKQIEGFKSIANALSAITAGDPNVNMQFSQEIRALRDMQDKGSNRLVQLLKSIDPEIKQHIEQWKKIGQETGNYGLVLEKINPLLQGFAAAQGDINSLWETVKSTMGTIRDEVLRGGLSQGFAELVNWMREVSKSAEDNKEKIQAFIKGSFEKLKTVSSVVWEIGKGFAALAEPAMYAAIGLGVTRVIDALLKLQTAMKVSGMAAMITSLPTLIGVIGVGTAAYIAKTGMDEEKLKRDVLAIKSGTPDAKSNDASLIRSQQASVANLNTEALAKIKERFPLADNNKIANLFRQNAISLESMIDEEYGRIWYKVNFNESKIAEVLKPASIPYPKGVKVGIKSDEDNSKFNEGVAAFEKLRKAWDTWDEKADRSGKISDELTAKIKVVEDEYAQLADTITSASSIDSKNTEIIRKHIAARKDEIIENLKLTEWYKEFIRLSKEAENQIKSDKAVFVLNTAAADNFLNNKFEATNGHKGKNRYAVTNPFGDIKPSLLNRSSEFKRPINYGLNTNFYGIPQDGKSSNYDLKLMQEQLENSRKLQSTIGGDNYGSKFANMTSNFELEKAKLQEQYSQKLMLEEDFNRKMLAAQEQYAAEKSALNSNMATDALQIAKQGFAGNKEMMIAVLAVEKAIAISRILANVAVAKSAAMASAMMLGPLAPAMMAASEAEIDMGAAIQIGMVVASGAMEGMQIAGKRASGGPVDGNKTYLIGEKGPELFTPGSSGMITANDRINNSSPTYAPVFQIDARNSTLSNAEIEGIVKRASERSKSEILHSMNRGGEFALASGRSR